MLDLLATETFLSILIPLVAIVGSYFSLHYLLELYMIRSGQLKTVRETSWDDVRALRDSGQIYWALRRFRQLKRKTGRHLPYREAMIQLQKL